MNSYIHLATQQAKLSGLQYRMGAVLVRGNTVVGAACNQTDHPKLRRWRSRYLTEYTGLHAEMAVLWGQEWRSLRGMTLYVVRVRADGTLAMAKPCLLCQEIIQAAGIKKVYYTNRDGKVVKL